MNETATSGKLGFRADINGLRAIAVLAVMAYHFGVPPFAGGFVGVDVFFVISGYLMTGIILGRMERGTFSVFGFYLDRARRIVPALVVLIAAVLALGWFILLPLDYIVLSKHSASSALFASNLLYWTEAGYFDVDAGQKWLLHTWSLSVEWQFYLLYPWLLLVIAKLAPRHRRAWLGGVTLLGFATMLWCSATQPSAGFFLLPPRAWEMLVGGLVFLAPAVPPRASRALQLAGLAAILGATALASPLGWPSAWALAPVGGTALVILAARTESRLTGNPVAAWTGLNSYSIYLWHWPVVVLLHRWGYFGDPLWTAGGFALALLLGHLSWRFIERIAYSAGKRPRIHTAPIHGGWRAHIGFVAAVSLVALAGAAIWKTRGAPWRYSPEVRFVATDSAPRTIPEAVGCFAGRDALPRPCVLGPAKAPTLAAFIGDSHADAGLPGFLAAVPPSLPGGVAFQAYRACPPVLGAHAVDAAGGQCGAFLERFLEPYAAPRRIPLVLVGSWITNVEAPALAYAGGSAVPNAGDFLANLYRSSCKLAAAGPTYVVLPTPQFPYGVANELQYRLIRDPHAGDIGIPLAEHLARERPVIATLQRAAHDCGVRLLDPVPYLCSGGICHGSIGHRAVIRDATHLTTFGATLLAPMYARVFADMAPGPAARR